MNAILQESRQADLSILPRGELTSLQSLGEAKVLVCYSVTPANGEPVVVVSGCYINGEFVRADNFSERVLCGWERDLLVGEVLS